jgi:hypothetical protein
LVPVEGDGNTLLGQIAPANWPRENFEFDKIGKDDAQAAWGLQIRGTDDNPDQTATKSSIENTASGNRLEKERSRVLQQFYLRGVAKGIALKQLFADDTNYVRVAGADGVKRLQAWDKTTIQGRFAFDIKTDSGKRQDISAERQQISNWINFSGKSQYIDQSENWRQAAEAWGKDPTRLVVQPQPPSPPPATSSVQLKPDDFVGPAGPIAMELAKACGIVISPEALQATQQLGAQAAAAMAQQQVAEAQAKAAPEQAAVDKHELMDAHARRSGLLPGPRAI